MMGRKMPLPSETTVTVTVVQEGMPDIQLQCPGMFRSFIWKNNLPDRRATVGNRFLICVLVGGTNIRELLVDNGINVYRSVTRWTNCKGKQRCGTCIVDVSHLTTHFKQLNCDPFLWTCLLQQQCSLPLIRHFPSLITIFDHHLWSTSSHQVLKNPGACTRKSLNENSALLENPESYRLSCITSVYEDVTLEVQGPVGEAALERIQKVW